MNNRFSELKNIFIEGGVHDYVNLDKSVLAYRKIMNSLEKPLKLILFYGKPGTGKTFLLNKIKNDLKEKNKKVILFERPFFDETEFLKHLYKEIFGEPILEISGYENFLEIYQKKMGQDKEAIIVLLDEAQLYPSMLMEKIRLMADTRDFKFLFTVHKTEKEDTLARDYFKTRIWENIELSNSSSSEIETYLKQKFIFHNLNEYFEIFNNKHFKLLYEITNGNLRTLNKLMYKVFEIYEYLESTEPSLISNKFLKKYIEMSAISLELIDA